MHMHYGLMGSLGAGTILLSFHVRALAGPRDPRRCQIGSAMPVIFTSNGRRGRHHKTIHRAEVVQGSVSYEH